MFELVLLFSRYLFAFYIIFYLWQGVVYVAEEQGHYIGNPYYAVSIQRIIIIFFHITAYLILAYIPGEFFFNIRYLLVGAGGLLFIIIALSVTRRVYKKSCPLIWNSMIFLLDIGMVMLQRLKPELAEKQLVWMTFGVCIMLLIPLILKLIPRFEMFEKLYIIVSYILILSTIVFGDEEFGSVNWLTIGKISFQPSEIVKFLFIFYLASVFRKRIELKQLIVTGSLSAGIVLLLVMQKDLGGALIFFLTYMAMLYIATSNAILFFSGMGAASIAAVIAYKLFSHVRVRVAAWKNPWSDVEGGGYQIVQSLFAISTWGLFGSGLTKGMPQSIPVVERDFIFSAICEEFGTIFAMGIVCIFIMIFFRGIKIALRCERRYYSLLAAGITTMFAFQSFIIIGGVIKLIPMTGVTLPFVNYGGSSVVVSIIMIGLLQWIESYYEIRSEGSSDY